MIRARYAPSTDRERIVVDISTDHDADSQLWWETTAGEPPPIPDRMDPVAIALVAKAMNFTQDLHLEGPVSWQLLANLEEFIDAWTLWCPDLFRRVRLSADEVIDDRGQGSGPRAGQAVTAFSGGVDGTYGAFAHQLGQLGRRSHRVTGAVLVHGFDIPLDNPDGFELARRGAEAMTGDVGIPLIAMRTNWQGVANPDWQMTFSTAVAAMLHLFTDRAGVALQAADNTYGQVTIPWGSNPITGPFLSSGRMRLVHPGAGTTRTEKVRAIGGYTSVREHIRVCWEGDQLGRNCGRCEKCLRTKVNFLAAGHGVVPALGPIEPGDLRSISIGSDGAYAITAELLEDVDHLPPEIVDDLRWLLDQPVTPHGSHPPEGDVPPASGPSDR
jgi:hypothetical protein